MNDNPTEEIERLKGQVAEKIAKLERELHLCRIELSVYAKVLKSLGNQS